MRRPGAPHSGRRASRTPSPGTPSRGPAGTRRRGRPRRGRRRRGAPATGTEMTEARRGLPRPALALIGSVAVAGAALVAIRVPAALEWTWRDLAAFATLAAVIAVLEQFWIEIPHGTERENFSVTDA